MTPLRYPIVTKSSMYQFYSICIRVSLYFHICLKNKFHIIFQMNVFVRTNTKSPMRMWPRFQIQILVPINVGNNSEFNATFVVHQCLKPLLTFCSSLIHFCSVITMSFYHITWKTTSSPPVTCRYPSLSEETKGHTLDVRRSWRAAFVTLCPVLHRDKRYTYLAQSKWNVIQVFSWSTRMKWWDKKIWGARG